MVITAFVAAGALPTDSAPQGACVDSVGRGLPPGSRSNVREASNSTGPVHWMFPHIFIAPLLSICSFRLLVLDLRHSRLGRLQRNLHPNLSSPQLSHFQFRRHHQHHHLRRHPFARRRSDALLAAGTLSSRFFSSLATTDFVIVFQIL